MEICTSSINSRDLHCYLLTRFESFHLLVVPLSHSLCIALVMFVSLLTTHGVLIGGTKLGAEIYICNK